MVLMTLWVLTFDPTNIGREMAQIRRKEEIVVPADICKNMQKLVEAPIKLKEHAVAMVTVRCTPIAKK